MNDIQKIRIIGGNAAGLSAASAIRRAHPDWDIIVYEKSEYISYGACGIPYYSAELISNLDSLITITREQFKEKRNIPVLINHEVTNVNFDDKKITIKNPDGSKQDELYDKLIITTGAHALKIKTLELNHPRLFTIHTLDDAKRIRKFLQENTIKHALLIGAGYIGLEMLEVYKHFGIEEITVVDKQLILGNPMQTYIEEELSRNRVNIRIGNLISKLESKDNETIIATLDNGDTITADFVQIAIGVKPATDLFKNTDLELARNGAIVIDRYCRTNIPDVFAAGDCAVVYNRLLKKNVYMPLAPAANKLGRLAGRIVSGQKVPEFPGIVGTAVFKVLGKYIAKTGLTPNQINEAGIKTDFIKIDARDVARYYPTSKKISILLRFEIESHKLISAEIIAESALGGKKIDVLATALNAGMTIEELQELDLAYAPPFAPTWDPILIAANVAKKKIQSIRKKT